MSDTNKKLKKTQHASRRQKAIIIGLSVALGLAGTAAIAVPLALTMLKKSPEASQTFTVKFLNTKGQTVADQHILKGEKATRPQISSVVEGDVIYEVDNWVNGDKVYDFSLPVTSNLELTATWKEQQQYTSLTFVGNGGTFSGEEYITKDKIIKNSSFGGVVVEHPTQDDHEFKCWTLDQAGNQPVDTNKKVDGSFNVVYAQWISTVVTYKVKFESNGSTVTGVTEFDVGVGTKWSDIKNKQASASKEGYDFDYWYLDGTSGEEEIADDYVFTANTKLLPHFTEKEVPAQTIHVIFNADSSKGQTIEGTDDIQVVYDESSTWKNIPKPIVSQKNKIFSTWSTNSDPTVTTDYLSDATSITTIIPQPAAPLNVYPVFVDEDVVPIIRFSNPIEEQNADTYTWVGGSQNVVAPADKITEQGVKWTDIEPYAPMVFKNAKGNWYEGITSEWYFTGWVMQKEGEAAKQIPEYISDAEVFIRPQFAEKDEVVFKVNGVKIETTDPIKVAPTDTFGSIKVPTLTSEQIGTDNLFDGWKAKVGEEATEAQKLSPNIPMKEIQKTGGKIEIEANLVEKTSCYNLEFTANPVVYVDGGSGEPKAQEVLTDKTQAEIYYGTYDNMAVSKNEEDPTDLSIVNKPIFHDDTKAYSFDYWEYSIDGKGKWKKYSDGEQTPLPTSLTGTDTVYVRAVVAANVDLTFDCKDYEIEGQPAGTKTFTLKVSSKSKFKDIGKPTLKLTQPGAGNAEVFKYWVDANGKAIDMNKQFATPTTVYPLVENWIDKKIIKYELLDADKSHATIKSNSQVGYSLVSGSGDLLFKEVGKPTIEYEGKVVDYWTTNKTDPASGKLTDNSVIPTGTTTVYPVFTDDQQYKKITLTTADPDVKLVKTELYIKSGEKLYSNLQNMATKDGCPITGWYNETESENVTATYTVSKAITVHPIFGDAVDINVKLSKNGNTSIVMNEDTLTFKYGVNILESLADIKPTWAKSKHVGWQKLADDGSLTTITSSDILTSKITVVPLFSGESDFENDKYAYYYDTDKELWACILGYEGNSLTIKYSTGELSTTPKNTFNSEIKFGNQMTSIPDHFLAGCTNFNNGAEVGQSKPLVIKSTAGITSIGKEFLFGCTQFDQSISFSLAESTKTSPFYIGEFFMGYCLSFNHDIDLSSCYSLRISGVGGFMHECQSFNGDDGQSQLLIPKTYFLNPATGEYEFEYCDDYTLSSALKTSVLYQKGFKCTNIYAPSMPNGPLYRNHKE